MVFIGFQNKRPLIKGEKLFDPTSDTYTQHTHTQAHTQNKQDKNCSRDIGWTFLR
jgi:hypothetical protein